MTPNTVATAPLEADAGETKRASSTTVVALSTDELVKRFGSAGAEYRKGYVGFDHEAGVKLAKGLKDISQYKVNPQYVEQNLKQQAGFSAEVVATSRDNAEAIIAGSEVRAVRSDDLPQYGPNHNVVDRVKILDGNIIDGTESQMKFVASRDALFNKITRPDGEFARYRGVKLELPSEQYEGAGDVCRQRATELRHNAQRAEEAGHSGAATRLRQQAENYEQLADNLLDSGLTTEDAVFYRTHPRLATAVDIARTSHRAGVEGAKTAGAVGLTISLVQNAFDIALERKQTTDALKDVAVDAGKAVLVGYGSAAAGSAIKGLMQQSSHVSVRALSNTTVPTLALNVCLSLGTSIHGYVKGELDEAQLLEDVGEKGVSMLSTAMMAALGQVVIPVPVLGAVIGGMIGTTLSSFFYQSTLQTRRDVELSRLDLERVQIVEQAARAEIARQREALRTFMSNELAQLSDETTCLFTALDSAEGVDELAQAVNVYAELLGARLPLCSVAELDRLMLSDKPLRL